MSERSATKRARGLRRRGAIILVLGALAVGPISAQTSVGIILGEPTGLSAKQWLGEGASLDLAVAWSFLDTGSFYAHIDYQQHFDDLDVDEGELLWFVGGGVKLSAGQELNLGVRIPIGLVYEFAEAPLEVFIEAAPGMDLFPAVQFNGGGGIGIRYRL